MEAENKNDLRIQGLTGWDFPDTVRKWVDYDTKSVPEATTNNMVVMMDKINELVETVNKLTEVNKGLIDALNK